MKRPLPERSISTDLPASVSVRGMSIGRHLRRAGIRRIVFGIALAALGATAVALPGGPATRAVADSGSALGAGGEYHALTPTRIFDSRPESSIHDVDPLGVKPATPQDLTFDVQLLDLGGVPAEGVLAVMANVTVVAPTANGHLSAYPTNQRPDPLTSIVNFTIGTTVPNSALLVPGADGNMTMLLHGATAGEAHVVIDVFGWFSSSAHATRGARLHPLTPKRVFDTRPSETPDGWTPTGPLEAGGVLQVPIAGHAGVPSSGVSGVFVNVTGVSPTAHTHLSVLPEAPTEPPNTSNLNLAPRDVRANASIVPIGDDGKIYIYNHAGLTDVVVDVVGYLEEGVDVETYTGRVVPLSSPFRLFDTREATFGSTPLGPRQAETWGASDFVASVSIGGVSGVAQIAAIGTLTDAGTTRQYPTRPLEGTFLTLYSGDITPVPVVSNLNAREGKAVPNLAMIRYDAATTFNVYNEQGYTHYLYDVAAVVLG